MDVLVGHTGFVGSNLVRCHDFDVVVNSRNTAQAFGVSPDLCVYAGVRAEKFLAAADPLADDRLIDQAIANITRIDPQRLVLISTVDVYPRPCGVDEATVMTGDSGHPYGRHRRRLERWVEENISCYLIVRLPALFGVNLKKNFLHDLIDPVPSLLARDLFASLSPRVENLGECYQLESTGFYRLVRPECHESLMAAFSSIGFSAVNFTDSRSSFQFYHLKYLWDHLQIALQHDVPVVNLAVEPLRADEVYHAVRGSDFVNEISDNPPVYDMRTMHWRVFAGDNGYVFSREQVLGEIMDFVAAEESKAV